MSVAAIHSLSLLKQTLTSLEYQITSKPELQDKPSSRYEPKITVNGLYSERSSSCYNLIKKKRMMREGRSRSHLKASSRQRATIAVDELDPTKNYNSDASLGHCISHLDSIIQLLKNQKDKKEMKETKQQKPKGPSNDRTTIKVTNEIKGKKSRQDIMHKSTVEKRYRTVSHSQNIREQEPQPSIEGKQSLVLKFNKKRSCEDETSDVKPLVAKIISETKRESKTLRLKEIRDRYKHLSKSKSSENYEMVSKINVQTLNNESNRRYGRKMMRVCSSGNYQVNSYDNRSREITQWKKNRYLKYDLKEEQKEKDGKEKRVQQPKEQKTRGGTGAGQENQESQEKAEVKLKQKPLEKIENYLIENKQNIIQELSQKSSRCFDLKEINCSKIDHKVGNRSLNSFFSEVPSYLASTKKGMEQPCSQNRQPVKPFKQDSNLLNLLDVQSLEIKKIFKAKERRKQLEKWKRNFPEGFFQQAKV